MRNIDALVARQHGLVSLAQLRELGVTRGELRWAQQDGRLVRAVPGVYASPMAPNTLAYRRTLGLLALGPDTMLSHDAAGALHEFDQTPRNSWNTPSHGPAVE